MPKTLSVMPKTLASHTPGPWKVQPLQYDQGGTIAICSTPGCGIIATIPPMNEDDEPTAETAQRDPCDEANARLIAAAPELLEALEASEDLLRDIGTAAESGNPYSRAELESAINRVSTENQAAIRKAKGEPSV
jgi:hypothetical protein